MITSNDDGQKELQELNEKLREVQEKVFIAGTSAFPIPVLMELAKEERRIISRMEELGFTGTIWPTAQKMLASEATIFQERLERLSKEE